MRRTHAAILSATVLAVPAFAQSYDSENNLWARDANPEYYYADLWARAEMKNPGIQGGGVNVPGAQMEGPSGMGFGGHPGMGAENPLGMGAGAGSGAPHGMGFYPPGASIPGQASINKLQAQNAGQGEEAATRPVLKKPKHNLNKNVRRNQNSAANSAQQQRFSQNGKPIWATQGLQKRDIEGDGFYEGALYARDANSVYVPSVQKPDGLKARNAYPLGFNMREDGLRTREAYPEEELDVRGEEDFDSIFARDAEADELDDLELYAREADPEAWAEAWAEAKAEAEEY